MLNMSRRAPSRVRLFCVLLAGVTISCGDSTAPPSGDGRATLTVVKQPTGAAAVAEAFSTPLTLLVRKSDGSRAPGVRIWFAPLANGAPRLMVSRTDSSDTGDYFADTTRADGTLTVLVWSGYTAGHAAIVANVSDIALADTLELDVLPGAAAGVRTLPADTALRVAGAGMVRAEVIDAFGNARQEGVALHSVTPSVVGIGANGSLDGLSVGRGMVVATYGAFADTTMVSVVPPGRLAAVHASATMGGQEEIVLLDTDGANMHPLRSAPLQCNRQLLLTWQPGFDRVVYADNDGCPGAGNLYRVTDGAVITTLLNYASLDGGYALFPSYSADGDHIYFTRWGNDWRCQIWRSDADGASPEVVVPPAAGDYMCDEKPALSPDGTRLAFVSTRRDGGSDPKLSIYSMTTGEITLFDIYAQYPRWSPDGSMIAFVHAGALKVVSSDGTGIRTLATADYPGFGSGLDWSPDGQWVIAGKQDGLYGTDNGLVLFNVESDLALPLAFDRSLRNPRWKP